MRLTAAAAVLAGALVLASCGGSSHRTPTSAATASATTTSASKTTASTTSASTTSTQTQPPSTSAPTTTAPASNSTSGSGGVAAAGPPLCRAADLSVAFLGGEGATGHGELGFALRNTSGHPCHTYGYPGVLLLGKGGRALPTHSTRTTQDFFGSTPLQSIQLRPGANASFRLTVSHGSASAAGCTTAAGLQVIPPNDTSTLRVTIGNGGAFECGGQATVSPLRPGNSAFP